MITEDYCSFEVSKLLKKKGFETLTDKVYDNQGKLDYQNVVCCQEKRLPYISAPTHQMAMKWLREEKGICIVIYPYDSSHKERYEFEINERLSEDPYMWESYMEIKNSLFEGYNTCVEAALKYSLENLI